MELLIYVVIELFSYLLAAIPWGGREIAEPQAPKARPIRRAPVEAIEVRVKNVCAFCRSRDGTFVTCRKCKAAHHADCARLNGRCAVFGCWNRGFRAPPA
jgi:hypothetical protein